MRAYISRIAICCSAVFIAVVSCSAATPTVVAYEGFDYSAGESLSGQSGGTGWTSNWHTTYYDGDLQVVSPGYTYTGLSTVGNRIGFGTGGSQGISQSYRSFDRLSSGKAYVQCLFQSSATGTGGTPQLRIEDSSAGAVIGLGASDSNPNNISLMIGALEDATDTPVSSLNLLLLEIDYESEISKLWINPDLSTFDYENPQGTADAEIAAAPEFDGLSVYFRSGSYIDEIKVMSIPEPATMAILAAASGVIMLKRRKQA